MHTLRVGHADVSCFVIDSCAVLRDVHVLQLGHLSRLHGMQMGTLSALSHVFWHGLLMLIQHAGIHPNADIATLRRQFKLVLHSSLSTMQPNTLCNMIIT